MAYHALSFLAHARPRDDDATRGAPACAAPQCTLDKSSTPDALLGQRRAAARGRPRPPAHICKHIAARLPKAAFHFWDSDRI